MIVQQEVTLKRNTVICDFCGDVLHRETLCEGCQKHVCTKCRNLLDEDPWTGEHLGDYASQICKKCDEKLFPFAKLAENIRREAAKQISRLEDAWKSDCRYVGVGSGELNNGQH